MMRLPQKTKRKRHLRELIGFAVLAIAVIGMAWLVFAPPQTTQTPPTSTRKLAPDFTLTGIWGEHVHLSDFHGKVVVLEFMRTTCPHCVNEMTELVALEHTANGITMISVTVDPEGDTVEVLERFIKNYGAPYSSRTQWLFARDTADVTSLYGISSVPTIIIIDEDGYIVQVNTGEVELQTLQQQIEAAQAD